jgi:hypothetical protein
MDMLTSRHPLPVSAVHLSLQYFIHFKHRYTTQLMLLSPHLYRMSEKDWTLFYFFSRCPVCGEWCKLHWLLLDTPSFDLLIDRLIWYIKDSNITSGAPRNIFEKGAIFFGHPVLYWDVRSAMSGSYATCHILSSFIIFYTWSYTLNKIMGLLPSFI